VRFQGDNWQARTKRSGREVSLGLYNSAEEAAMAYDLDRLQQQGGKAQRLNFPLLRQHYKQILSDLAHVHQPDGLLDFLAVAVQAAAKAAHNVPGATALKNTGPVAASLLNSRRTAASMAAVSQPQTQLAACPPTNNDADLCTATKPSGEQLTAAVPLHTSARAGTLAEQHPLHAGLALKIAHVHLQPGNGLKWQVAYLACPTSVTVRQVKEVGMCFNIETWQSCCPASHAYDSSPTSGCGAWRGREAPHVFRLITNRVICDK
jgi:hypothetical protein